MYGITIDQQHQDCWICLDKGDVTDLYTPCKCPEVHRQCLKKWMAEVLYTSVHTCTCTSVEVLYTCTCSQCIHVPVYMYCSSYIDGYCHFIEGIKQFTKRSLLLSSV